jgi:hypothetical protein
VEGRRLLPWLLLLLALPVALWGVAVSAPAACDQLPTAFDEGVTTTHSGGLGSFVVDRCETTRAVDGAQNQVTVVNWSGLIAGMALCLAAWLAGALLAGRVPWRTGGPMLGASVAAYCAAVAAFLA